MTPSPSETSAEGQPSTVAAGVVDAPSPPPHAATIAPIAAAARRRRTLCTRRYRPRPPEFERGELCLRVCRRWFERTPLACGFGRSRRPGLRRRSAEQKFTELRRGLVEGVDQIEHLRDGRLLDEHPHRRGIGG